MRIKTYKKHVFYLLGGILYAFWINLGSALSNLSTRLQTPYIKWMIPLTLVLLLVYLYYLSRVVHRFHYADHFFKRLPYPLRLAAFLFFTLLLVCMAHSLLIFTLLSQRQGGMQLFVRYFSLDFWVFALPLLVYCLLLYHCPEIALFRFKRVDRLEKRYTELLERKQGLRAENEHLKLILQQLKDAKKELEKRSLEITIENLLLAASGERYQQQQEEMLVQKRSLLQALESLQRKEKILLKDQQELIDEHRLLKMELERLQRSMETTEGKAELLLNSWQEQRSMLALLSYVRAMDNRKEMPAIHALRVHHVVIGYRKDRCYFIVDEYGRKQIIADDLGRELAECAWFVKTKQQVYLNMLHCTGELQKIEKTKGMKRVLLDEKTRQRMEGSITAAELDNLLNLSRRLEVDFSVFWGKTRFTLDETGLFVAFRPSDGRGN